MPFKMPPSTGTDTGDTRRVGYEIEYSGIEINASAEILNGLLDGDIQQTSPFSLVINDTHYGDFRIEIDAAFLQDEKYLEYLKKIGIDIEQLDVKKPLEELLRDVASTVVPCEIVMPPVPVTDMEIAEEIVDSLRHNKAKGTGASFLYAFGLHINPEVVTTDVHYLLSHLRSFIVLFDLICEETSVDLSRRISPYINRYPSSYIRKVLNEDYTPDTEQLIHDYLQHNPSRNHALDMLPLFAFIDSEKVRQHAREPELINARPTFHYRLANSRIDEPRWNISNEWNYWVKIETLAGNEKILADLCSKYLAVHDSALPVMRTEWINTVRDTLEPDG